MNVLFFQSDKQKSPVTEFLDELNINQRVKILRQFSYLEEFGLNTAIPNTKKIKGSQLWELRTLGKDNIRSFYAQTDSKSITILHIFHKKTQKTPLKELRIALNRYKMVLEI